MIRTAVPRTLLRQSLSQACPIASRLTSCTARPIATSALRDASRSLLVSKARPVALTAYKQHTAIARRHAATIQIIPGTDGPLLDREKKRQQDTLQPEPQQVSTGSSVRAVTGDNKSIAEEHDEDMMKGIKGDLKVIKEVMALKDVPPEALRIGLAGVLPYLATASATVYCAFEYNTAGRYGGQGYFLSEQTAEIYLHILEPLQIGYGAVIISFLGAIHWGLEWAGYGGHHGYRRYAVGVFAPAAAWPTLLLPIEYALISQFVIFNYLYSKDAQLTKRGWTPPWYSTYRFILTFFVGTAIVLSLIGRGELSDRIGSAPSATERVRELNKKIKDQI